MIVCRSTPMSFRLVLAADTQWLLRLGLFLISQRGGSYAGATLMTNAQTDSFDSPFSPSHFGLAISSMFKFLL